MVGGLHARLCHTFLVKIWAQTLKRVVPGIHVAAIWFSQMTKQYACCMATIQKTYGFAICLLYGINIAGIWQSQMPAVWYAYGIHMAKPYSCHMDTIQEAYGSAHGNHIT